MTRTQQISLDSFEALSTVLLDVEQQVSNLSYSLELDAFQLQITKQQQSAHSVELGSNISPRDSKESSTKDSKRPQEPLMATGPSRDSLANGSESPRSHSGRIRGQLFATDTDATSFDASASRFASDPRHLTATDAALSQLADQIADKTVEQMKLNA